MTLMVYFEKTEASFDAVLSFSEEYACPKGGKSGWEHPPIETLTFKEIGSIHTTNRAAHVLTALFELGGDQLGGHLRVVYNHMVGGRSTMYLGGKFSLPDIEPAKGISYESARLLALQFAAMLPAEAPEEKRR